jgi:protoheme IX farnesyltransferase
MNILFDLIKIRITVLVAITTGFGYLLSKGKIDLAIIYPVIGIFLTASGSAAINHIQDSDIDAKMNRTKSRPLPSGLLSKWEIVVIASLLVLFGSAILWWMVGIIEMLLGILALVWYNLIYTPMKRKSPYAVIPGSIIGAIPPVVGWISGGGSLSSPESIFLAFFFFLWQIPHFWLLLLFLNNDYESSGIPTVMSRFSETQLARITFAWTFATALSALLFPLFHLVSGWVALLMIVISAGVLIIHSIQLLKFDTGRYAFRKAFMGINYFILYLVLVVSIDKLKIF